MNFSVIAISALLGKACVIEGAVYHTDTNIFNYTLVLGKLSDTNYCTFRKL